MKNLIRYDGIYEGLLYEGMFNGEMVKIYDGEHNSALKYFAVTKSGEYKYFYKVMVDDFLYIRYLYREFVEGL